MISSESSVRVDRARGLREEASFVDTGGERMLMVRHEPLSEVRGGVVVCPSIFVDRIRTYRAEVGLARRLASAGFAVQRFEYRGLGHSDGDTADVTYERLLQDASSAAGVLRDDGAQPAAVLGIRMGGLVAASLSAELGGLPLVLWAPIAKGRDYFREAFRASVITQTAHGGLTPPTFRSLQEAPEDGFVDLLGVPIYRRLYESCKDRELVEELGPSPRPILWLDFRDSARKGLGGTLAETLGSAHMDLTLEFLMARKEAWWFIADSAERFPMEPFVDTTLSWMEERCATPVS